MADFEPMTGGCGCGAVRFELRAAPVSALYCHCTRCQRRTGTAAAVSVLVEPGSVAVMAGEQHLRAWEPPNGRAKVFCELCGSAVFTREPGEGPILAVRMSAFDGDPGVRPSARQYVAYAAPWEPIPDDGLARYDERMPR